MFYLNQSTVAGVIGGDIDLRSSDDGELFCRFVVGTVQKTEGLEGANHHTVNWHRCIATGDVASDIDAQCQKGTNIYLTGKSSTKFFESEEGIKKEATEVNIDEFKVIAEGKEAFVDLEQVLADTQAQEEDEIGKENIPY